MRNEETNEEYEPFSVVESFPDFHPMIYVTKEKGKFKLLVLPQAKF